MVNMEQMKVTPSVIVMSYGLIPFSRILKNHPSRGTVTMKIFLENLYHSDCYFLPIRDNQQDLVGVELITHFSSEDGTVRIPTSRVIAQLTEEQHWQLFSEQLELLKSCQHFFIQHKLFAWLNLTPHVATLLLDRDNFAGELLKYPFIELLINENYPHFNEGKDNRDLLSLSQMYPLVLGNLGAGNSTMKAVFDGLFTRVMLDKSFIQQQITHRSFEPFIRAIQAQISPCCNCIIAGGIDTPEILAQIIPFDFHALQGCLWPAVPINQITTLVQR